jgi:hypothetical protein
MTIRTLITILPVSMLSVLTLQGCNRYVSQGEYLDTAFTDAGYSSPEIYGYVPPGDERAVDMTPQEPDLRSPPHVIVIDQRDESWNEMDRGSWQASPTAETNRSFASDTRRELDELGRDLARLEARAKQKGAAAEAAVDPAARDLRIYRSQIEDRLDEIGQEDDWDAMAATRSEITDMLRDAHHSLANAVEDVNGIPSND